jgi:hypothetical protein
MQGYITKSKQKLLNIFLMEISKRNSFKILIHIIYGRSMGWPWYGMVKLCQQGRRFEFQNDCTLKISNTCSHYNYNYSLYTEYKIR